LHHLIFLDKKPQKGWPQRGAIKFENVYLNYDGKDVLQNLNFSVKPCQRIGVIGRTGAGKSSIITALFRLVEPRGFILIDDVNIIEIGLHDLRKAISIIPQDPILFSETIRYNIDPFGEYSDDHLWQVLEQVTTIQLKKFPLIIFF
jgi:ABC-type multidrug transport system fused ATPase/permease subunit